jgi:ribonuclease E
MAKRMLIDAAHPEEIRVAVIKGNRLEDFDFETATKKQLKGNIYLAKVTRVEPSLQAAFVDYGGNRHGFLAFNEIHPDYYRIPIADREALIAQEKAMAERDGERGERPEGVEVETETVGGEDIEEVAPRRFRVPRPYKIQEVTKRRQILLVQVVKEERGNKGAALTTYLSLAGRYCVLMPNTPRGGGISRKITNVKDRRRLKSILEEFEVPEGMSVIVRTAGMERNKTEIKRDLEYLMRLWDEIRELTLNSTAPALIYEEASLIKRAIRDLYDRDIDDIQVEGDDGYRAAKDFMRMLTPSHAKRVQQYRDDLVPLFHRFQVESQIDAIHSPTVNLKSGGYIVITPTEALVSIDVNSGRATKERNIEETALKTNSEAAEEIARQVRLRDLAGLIVIDFIDMEENRNNATVERKIKEAMRIDRARIQIGRISAFGLLELSRQRLRPSLVEATMQQCTYCGGSGWVRSTESTALHVMRGLEEEGIRRRSAELKLTVPRQIALYLLNQKRGALAEIERRYGFTVEVTTDDLLVPPAYRLDRLREFAPGELPPVPVRPETVMAALEADRIADDAAADAEIEDESDAEFDERDDGEERGESRAPSWQEPSQRDERGPDPHDPHSHGHGRHGQGQPGQPPSGGQGPYGGAPGDGQPWQQGDRPSGEGRRRRRRRRRRGGGGQGQPGPFPQGQSPQGQSPQNQFPQGQPPQGQFPQGQFPHGQFPHGQFPLGQSAPSPFAQPQPPRDPMGQPYPNDLTGVPQPEGAPFDPQQGAYRHETAPGAATDPAHGEEQREFPAGGDGQVGPGGEGRRRRARGRRGGRRRRRGGEHREGEFQSGETQPGNVPFEPERASMAPNDAPRDGGPSSTQPVRHEPRPEPQRYEPPRFEAPRYEPPRYEPARPESTRPESPAQSEPRREMPREPQPAASQTAPPKPAEPIKPAVPVILVDEGSTEAAPKKRGWWSRLTE